MAHQLLLNELLDRDVGTLSANANDLSERLFAGPTPARNGAMGARKLVDGVRENVLVVAEVELVPDSMKNEGVTGLLAPEMVSFCACVTESSYKVVANLPNVNFFCFGLHIWTV